MRWGRFQISDCRVSNSVRHKRLNYVQTSNFPVTTRWEPWPWTLSVWHQTSVCHEPSSSQGGLGLRLGSYDHTIIRSPYRHMWHVSCVYHSAIATTFCLLLRQKISRSLIFPTFNVDSNECLLLNILTRYIFFHKYLLLYPSLTL